MSTYPIPHPDWQGDECFMCEGTGHDRAPVMGEPNGTGIRRVLGHVELDRRCRACNGHGKDPS